jgi:Holliday junction resolvase
LTYACKRVDKNQKQIVGALRAHGISVAILASLGSGVPDILCGLPDGRNVLIEIKSERGAKLTPHEQRFIERWQGAVFIVYDAQEALSVLGF